LRRNLICFPSGVFGPVRRSPQRKKPTTKNPNLGVLAVKDYALEILASKTRKSD